MQQMIDRYHSVRQGPLLLFPGALRRVAELMKSIAEGSENTGRAIPGETVAKTLLSHDQKLEFYLLLLYLSLKFLLKKKQLQIFSIPSPFPMTEETQFPLHLEPVSLLLDVVGFQ